MIFSKANLDVVGKRHPEIIKELEQAFLKPIAEFIRRRIEESQTN